MANNYCGGFLKSINLDCQNNPGGIKAVYIAAYKDLEGSTLRQSINFSDRFGRIESISLNDELSELMEVYAFKKNTSSVATTLNYDEESGARFYESEISLKFHKLDQKKFEAVQALANTDFFVIVQLGNSEWFIYGLDYPMAVESVTVNTGTAFTDFNGIEMTLKDSALSLPYRVDSTYMDKQIKAYDNKE